MEFWGWHTIQPNRTMKAYTGWISYQIKHKDPIHLFYQYGNAKFGFKKKTTTNYYLEMENWAS